MRDFRRLPLAIAATICTTMHAPAALAKDITIVVDARSAPWNTGVNAKMRFGLADARPPKVVWDSAIRPGAPVTIVARGETTTVAGGGSFGPIGDTSWPQDHGAALFPSHFIRSPDPVYLNQLIGAFISADGIVVGMPFAIGEKVKISVPDGASALSLGINDDRYADNKGSLTVDIHIGEAQVIVEKP